MVKDQCVATLQADTGSGGLFELGDPMVTLATSKPRERPRNFGRAEVPVIVVRCQSKIEDVDLDLDTLTKVFEVDFICMTRSSDLDDAEEKMDEILTRLEDIIREQTHVSKLWLGLPSLINDAQGVLISRPVNTQTTSFPPDDPEFGIDGEFCIIGIVQAQIQVPVGYDFFG